MWITTKADMDANNCPELRRCEFCGCETNARLRACRDKGRAADRKTPNAKSSESINKHLDAPAHWFGPGMAPNFSRKVAQAAESVQIAQKNLMDALIHAYPEGRRVTVIHYRGQFYGHVTGWDHHGSRVCVKNERTQKLSMWWAAHVQLAED